MVSKPAGGSAPHAPPDCKPVKSVGRTAAVLAGAATAAWVTRAGWGLPMALGAWPMALRAAAARSSQYRDGAFVNVEPSPVLAPGSSASLVVRLVTRRGRGRPDAAIPLARPANPVRAAAELAATWYGHASALAEVDGHRVLLDPVWGNRVSPSPLIGPARLHPPPVAIAEVPPVDAVLISHDHYDHLDLPTVRSLLRSQAAPFVVPLGIGAHLRHWGVPASRIVELDWGEETVVGGLRLICAPARHFSGRALRRDNTLWSSWVIRGPRNRVYFGGDTGYTSGFAGIGRDHGPFGLTLLPIGAYGAQWPHIHMTPEEAVRAHLDLGGRVLLPIHWATFDLAFHSWAEPVQRLHAAAAEAGIVLASPRPGQRISSVSAIPTQDWWSALAR